jgi:flagellar operon protein (TIGR03826 family)
LERVAELRNCPQCGRIFAYLGRNVCPRCLDKEEEEFKIVRSYVREHSGATITETAEATGVDEHKILGFLRDGRLISRGLQASVTLECERCGMSIPEGRYCRSCREELERELKQSLSRNSPRPEAPESTRDREKIHILDKRGNKKSGK